MLPNHAPLVIAEQFGTLAALFPGRIDLGLGRAPGTDQSHRARPAPQPGRRRRRLPARRGRADGLLPRRAARPAAFARCPGAGLDVPVWILGSSLFGAQLAAMLGLPFAFASHFAPAALDHALAIYRGAVPAVGPAGRALRHAGPQRLRRRHRRRGAAPVHLAAAGLRQPAHRPARPPAAAGRDFDLRLDPAARATLGPGPDLLRRRRPGDGASAAWPRSSTATGADELMVTAQIFDHAARLRSFEIAADAHARIAPRPAGIG